MKTCLIPIDAQDSFRHRPFYAPTTRPAWLAAQNAPIAACQQTADKPFALASGQVRPIAGLAGFTPAANLHKSRHSALVGAAC